MVHRSWVPQDQLTRGVPESGELPKLGPGNHQENAQWLPPDPGKVAFTSIRKQTGRQAPFHETSFHHLRISDLMERLLGLKPGLQSWH